jgi:hypothetical protein
MTEATAAQLEYAPPLAWHKVRRWRKRFVVAGFVLAVVGFLYWSPPLWRHARLLYWQRQCFAYAAAPTRVVFEPDPQRAAARAADDGWVSLGVSAPVHSPHEWRGFSRAVQPGWAVGEPVIGLLDRVAPSGQSWLIAITLSTTGTPTLRAQLCSRAKLTSRPEHFRGQAFIDALSQGELPRLYAAQPDPADASRFTIRYELPDRTGVIKGRLHDNGTLELTDGH